MSKLKIEPIKNPDKIINYWKKEKLVVALIFLSGLIFNSGMTLGPIYQGKLIDSIVKGKSITTTLRIAITFVTLILIIQVLRYVKRFYIRRFANSTSATMRLMIYNNIMYKNTYELDNQNTGDLMTRAISDVELCVEGMRKFTTEIFDTGVLMITYLITMLIYDVKITFLSILFIPVAMVLAEKLKSYIYKYSITYRKKSSEVTDYTFDLIENAMLYRVNGLDKENKAKYYEHLVDLQNKAIKANILENSMQPVYNTIAMLGILEVIYLGGTKVIQGGWTVGAFSTYVSIFIAMAVKASKASKLFNSVQKSQISWKRIKKYMSSYKNKDSTLNINTKSTDLVVEKLSMNYDSGNTSQNRTNIIMNPNDSNPNDSNPLIEVKGDDGKDFIIENITFTCKQGDIIGITGPIASGKSSLGVALTGLYHYIGSIKIDGKELSDYSEYERSKMISYLGHKPELLTDTIYNNITLGKKQDISSVIKDVCFDTDLLAMPEGENTLVGNGGIRLSGGQQARIALARALLNKNKVIILDDPFSAVDMKTEKMIIQNLRNHYKDSIILLISHRLAIFNEISQIILLHSDKTVEYGTHDKLMNSSELYTSIYNLQNIEGENNRNQQNAEDNIYHEK